MDNTNSDSLSANSSWDRYWRGMKEGGQFGVGGASHPRLNQFWREYFSSMGTLSTPKKMIDIGCGDGAVVAAAIDTLGYDSLQLTCLDISRHSLGLLRQRYPDVHGIVADALHVPLDSGSFDLVTSQFAVEYAGTAAFGEAVRLVAPGGQLALLVHHRSSVMYEDCSASLDAVEGLKACQFITRSITLFETGFATLQGADRMPYDSAAQDMLPAYRELERIMQRHGKHVAGDTLLSLYQDVDVIHQHMERYDAAEILQWLTRINSELDGYVRIMGAMRDSALSEPQFLAVSEAVKDAGLTVQQALPLRSDEIGLPIAWVLTAHRPHEKGADQTA
jgi:ubiquinone/menaquinone biosynthesis C-methylase UbiE